MTSQVQKLIVDYYGDVERPAQIYTLISIVALIIDIISIFIMLGFIGTMGEQVFHAYLVQIICVQFYLLLDLYYILWTLHMSFRMHDPIRSWLLFAVLGSGSQMFEAFGADTGSLDKSATKITKMVTEKASRG